MLLAVVGGLLTATLAKSQGLDQDILRDSQRDRFDAAERTQRTIVALRLQEMAAQAGQGAPERDFTFKLTAPVFYNSNPDATPSGGSQTIEGNPDLLLTWKKMFGTGKKQWQLSGFTDASIDRFARSVGADGDSTAVNTRLQFIGDGHDQNFVPSLGFSETLSFQPTYARTASSFHDVTLSFDKPFNFDWKRDRLPGASPDTSSHTVWTIDLAGSLARRIGGQGAASRSIIKATPSLTYNPSMDRSPSQLNGADAQWSLSLACTAARLFSDEQSGVSRRDWYLQPLFTVSFIPPLGWFPGATKADEAASAEALGMPTATLQIAYTKLSSTAAAAEFQQWQVGPALVLAWKF